MLVLTQPDFQQELPMHLAAIKISRAIIMLLMAYVIRVCRTEVRYLR